MLSLAPAASAGEWVQRSCSFGNEPASTEGWEFWDNNGYDEPSDVEVRNGCFFYSMGGGLDAVADTTYGDKPGAGEEWTYKPPRDSAITGGVLDMQLSAPKGEATIGAVAKGGSVTLARCETELCYQNDKFLTIAASGWTELYERAACVVTDNGLCSTEGSTRAAEAEITSAQIILATNATPTASGFSGTLLNETVSGTGTLSFTATDPGPGVYQARVLIDGQGVWAGSPSLNEGKCVTTGTYEGARAFNYAQPCPTEAAVSAEIDTTSLADGAHHLTVEVEDAAGNVATVYSGTLTTANHPALSAPAPVRGPANGTPASESATLTAQWKGKSGKTASRLTSPYGRSHELIGRLTNVAGAPIAGALIEASQKPASLGAAASSLTGAHTNPQGDFTINLSPSISSTSIQLVYRSHLGDAQPVATRTLTLQVPASLHLTVSPHITSIGHTIVLGGKLAGPIPPGGKKVLFEARVVGGPWIEFHNATVNAHGRFRATHRFTFPGPISYQFRVVCEREADFPFLAGASNVVDVHER
jgi:hypothetical protein